VVRALDECRVLDSRPPHYRVTTLDKLFTPMCLCYRAVQIGTGQTAVMPYGRKGNRRFGVALAMCHRLNGLSTFGLTNSVLEMSIPPTLL